MMLSYMMHYDYHYEPHYYACLDNEIQPSRFEEEEEWYSIIQNDPSIQKVQKGRD
jgi:hypothetical protein